MMKDWISVNNNLPKENNDYLVYYLKQYKSGIKAYWNGICTFYDGKWETDEGETITHWMSLPEPPK